jgi:Cysteine-rich secretory protein family
MKLICFLVGFLLVMVSVVSSARAEDIIALISQYRREHGLPAVKTDAKLTAVATRQAQAMASSGIMDHDVAGSFASRIAGANMTPAAENIAAGTKTWVDTLRIWKESTGHNANLLLRDADSIGVAVARNENTRYKAYWAMVIGRKETKRRIEMAAGPDAGPRIRVRTTQTRAAEERSIGEMLTSAVTRLRSLLP